MELTFPGHVRQVFRRSSTAALPHYTPLFYHFDDEHQVLTRNSVLLSIFMDFWRGLRRIPEMSEGQAPPTQEPCRVVTGWS